MPDHCAKHREALIRHWTCSRRSTRSARPHDRVLPADRPMPARSGPAPAVPGHVVEYFRSGAASATARPAGPRSTRPCSRVLPGPLHIDEISRTLSGVRASGAFGKARPRAFDLAVIVNFRFHYVISPASASAFSPGSSPLTLEGESLCASTNLIPSISHFSAILCLSSCHGNSPQKVRSASS